MRVDRYTKLILTVIALELGWIAVHNSGVRVSAQPAEAMPVVIRGVEGAPGKEISIPVTLVGAPAQVRITSDRPLQIEAPLPLRIQADRPLPVQTGKEPLLIRTVPDPPATKPGV